MIVCVCRGVSEREDEAQLELITQSGEANYLAQQIKEGDA
jgi:bacterioferritin-associated ferredoxin